MTPVTARRLASLVGPLGAARAPRYVALADRVRLLVSDGRLPVGARLPAERELAAATGLSRATVTAAYARLREDGWAAARRGAGTWTRLPAGPDQGAWVPAPAAAGQLDLAHAAPAAPPQVAAAFAAALEELPRLLPGHGYHPLGLPGLRARVAERYTARGLPTVAEQVLVTGGALHGLGVALDALSRRGDRVLVETPTYPSALDALRSRGRQELPVAAAAEDFAASVARAVGQGRPRLAYLMPDHQNPTGRHAGAEERAALASALGDTAVVVDETLAELTLDGPDEPPFAAVAGAAATVSAGTLSKAVWGGLRIGWLRAEPDVIRRLAVAAAHTQLSGPVLEQLAACHLLDALPALLAARREELRTRRATLAAAVRDHLPEWEFALPAGGLVLWCALPAPVSSALVTAARGRGVLLAAGPRFGTGHAFEDRLRLPYTQPPDVLARGVERLAGLDVTAPTRAPAGEPEPVV